MFRCGRASAPLFAFIHGGYWQRNDKNMFACMAEGPLARGFDVAMIGYTLCPDVTLTELVAETHAAIRWLRKEGPKRGFGAGKLVVSGWSAGGHLTASALPLDEVDAGLAISGIYDVEPCRLNYLNEKLKLTADEAAAMSPILHLPKTRGPAEAADGRLRHRRDCRNCRASRATIIRRGSTRACPRRCCRSRRTIISRSWKSCARPAESSTAR